MLHFELPLTHVLMIFAPIIFVFVLISFKKVKIEKKYRKKKKILEMIIIISRTLIFIFLALALLEPFFEETIDKSEIKRLKVLIDNSHSMKLQDIKPYSNALDKLSRKGISVETRYVNMEKHSNIGDIILQNIEPGEDLFLISDGQNNFGSSFESVGLFASNAKTRIFYAELEDEERDAAIFIEGPNKGVTGVENTFTVKLNEVGIKDYNVRVWLDDELIFSDVYTEPINVKRSFTEGEYVFKAEILTNDYFKENNVYYKVVNIHKKPKVLFITTTKSPLNILYELFYDVEISTIFPSDLSPYYAVILNNWHADEITASEFSELEKFVSDGNGLLVVGGKKSYDFGKYNESSLSNLLPVKIGTADKKKDSLRVILLLDLAENMFGLDYSENEAVDDLPESFSEISNLVTRDTIKDSQQVVRSVALSLIQNMPNDSKLGMVSAGVSGSGVSVYNRQVIRDIDQFHIPIRVLSELKEVGNNRDELLSVIRKSPDVSASFYHAAYQKSYEMLLNFRGGKQIILIGDGIGGGAKDRVQLKRLVEFARKKNIATHTFYYGINKDSMFMQELAKAGGGQYNTIDSNHFLRLHFGDQQGNVDDISAYIYDTNHFITEELTLSGDLFGHNSVYPKQNSKMLVVTTEGEPLLVVWNYGLGRVASFSSDDGSIWAPHFLSKHNSAIMLRTLNWIIENPERKENFVLNVPELRIEEESVINLKSNSFPIDDVVDFHETSNDHFEGVFYTEEGGIKYILGKKIPVNYNKEYENIGMFYEGLSQLSAITGGGLLEKDSDKILETLKSSAYVNTTKRNYVSWVFVFVAILFYAIEILLRRIFQKNMLKVI